MPYHIRVLVPCYKESYDIVTRSLEVRTFRNITFQTQPSAGVRLAKAFMHHPQILLQYLFARQVIR
jgi:hypothetical protein